jgi:hypothetical protein
MQCRPSVISDDWVSKGFHLHVEHVELAVRPGHRPGMIVFRSCFASALPQDVDAAERIVRGQCLADPAVRAHWCRAIDRAIVYLQGYDGELAELANGRRAELSFLKRALVLYEAE